MTFAWYPGAHERLRTAFDRAIEDTAHDILDDLVDSGTIPHAEAATRPGHLPGRLQESGRVDVSERGGRKVRIIFDAPFAAKVYYHPEWNFSAAVNPHPRGRWFEPYQAGGEKAGMVRERFARHLRRNRWLG